MSGRHHPTVHATLRTLPQTQLDRAEQAVLHRAAKQAWTRSELCTVLMALGLMDYAIGARYGPTDGRRVALPKEDA